MFVIIAQTAQNTKREMAGHQKQGIYGNIALLARICYFD